jgi:hypothetical protein
VRIHRSLGKTAWLLPFALAAGFVAFIPSTVGSASEAPSIQSVLAKIPEKGRAPKTGYSRAQFGPTWADVDRNGCDTRNDILTRDLTSVVYRERTQECVVLSGVLRDPYSGTLINFVRGNVTSMEVQIDHVVALSNAWQTGAFKLSLAQRTAFANDRLNLLAVQGRLNSQKGDGDAATWLPPLKSYRCTYVARQVVVKSKYGLWMTKAEKEAITRILSACPNQPWPSS